MSRLLTPQQTEILNRQGITTAILSRLDFKTETVCVWTGADSLSVSGTSDSLLNGMTFNPLVNGVLLDVGENNFTMGGSDTQTLTLALPSAPSAEITAAMYHPSEYQSRPATLWRALLFSPGGPGTPPIWAFKRIRVGSMDYLEVQDDGLGRKFSMSIEGHAGRISAASGQTYLDQKSIDPTDTSQDYAVIVANGKPTPTKSTGWARMGEILQEGNAVTNALRNRS